jgi:glycosyltransferase involved in cell wall biosynthesis
VIAEKPPQVSIGMPVYNGEKFIREAIDSLLMQTFTDFELIISDNASTDSTKEICEEYAARDERIRYVRQQKNRGAGYNFKFIFDEAVADYFMWAAADDVWDKNWIEMLLPISVSGQCLAYGMVQTIDCSKNNMNHAANGRKFSFSGLKFFRRLKYFYEPDFLGKANPIYGIYPSKFITTDVLSILNENKSGADMMFLYRILEDIDIVGGSDVFLYKRIHDDCAGGDSDARLTKKRYFSGSIINVFFDDIFYHYQRIISYGALSNVLEKVVQLLLFPIIYIINAYCKIVNSQRFGGK